MSLVLVEERMVTRTVKVAEEDESGNFKLTGAEKTITRPQLFKLTVDEGSLHFVRGGGIGSKISELTASEVEGFENLLSGETTEVEGLEGFDDQD